MYAPTVSVLPANLFGLQILNVVQNHISGSIPGELSISLKTLNLSSNAFFGKMPSSIVNLSQVQLINFSYNQFFGKIPASLGELQQLQYLWLDHNLLGGTLPSALANCSALLHLSVEGNALTDVVPSAISALLRLQVMSLSQNNLTGSIPGSNFYNNFVHPPSLDVSNNALSDDIYYSSIWLPSSNSVHLIFFIIKSNGPKWLPPFYCKLT